MIVKEKLDNKSEEIRKRWNYHISKVYVICVLNYIMDAPVQINTAGILCVWTGN